MNYVVVTMDPPSLLMCPVCYDEFEHDLSRFTTEDERRSSRLPVGSHQCPHKMCASCLSDMQAVAISDKSARADTPKWFPCPSCKKKTSFNAVDIQIDLYACGTVAALKKTAPRAENPPVPGSDSQNTGPEEMGAPGSDIGGGDPIAEEDLQQEDDGEDADLGLPPCAEGDQFPHLEGDGSSDVDQPSNEGRRTKRSTKPVERHEAGSASGKRSKKESAAPVAQPDVVVTGTHGDTEWTQVVSGGSDNRKIVRIMEFAKDSITEHDTQGRLCSLWCLERGHIACANRVIPEEFLTDQDGALEYLREEQEGLIKAKCLKLPLFLDGIGHLWQYLLFARLRPGDLVILQLKAGARAPGEAVFGFIEDDSFIVKTKKQILKEENFPWKLDRGTTLDPWANGLMLRKVKWMRRGVMRDLPKQMITKRGDKQVSWMLENVTTF